MQQTQDCNVDACAPTGQPQEVDALVDGMVRAPAQPENGPVLYYSP
jgi:hypothetical protein